MSVITDQKGIALITALILTVLSMAVVMMMYYVMTLGIQVSGAQKSYRTAQDASYGGLQIVLKEIIPEILHPDETKRSLTLANNRSDISAKFSGIFDLNLVLNAGSLVTFNKLRASTTNWPATYSRTVNAKDSPDFSFNLAAPGGTTYNVYAKIVDTVTGNTNMGLTLDGTGVIESKVGVPTLQIPYIYRVELIAERTANLSERGKISVLYAY